MQLSSSLPCGIAFGQPSSKHESDIPQALQQQQQHQPSACNKAEPSSTRIEKLKSAAASTERLPLRCSAQEPGQIVGQPGAAVGVPVGGVAHKGELSKPEPAACIMNAGETPQTTALPCTLTMLEPFMQDCKVLCNMPQPVTYNGTPIRLSTERTVNNEAFISITFYSLNHLMLRLSIHFLVYPSVHSSISHSITHSQTQSLTHSLTHLSHPLIHVVVHLSQSLCASINALTFHSFAFCASQRHTLLISCSPQAAISR